MNAAEIVVQGLVKPDGSLELDEKLQLPPGRVLVTVRPTTEPVRPNQALVDAMARMAEIHKGMNPKEGKDTLEYLREAREGAMYGYDSNE